MAKDSPARPEFKPINVHKRRVTAMHPDNAWHLSHWYETPREDPAVPEVYTYTDALSYDPGDEVGFHTSSTAKTWTLQVWRDGARPELVYEAKDLPGDFHPTPATAYRDGCGWPESHRWTLPADMASGFYRIVSICQLESGANFLQHHFFVVRPVDKKPPRERFLLILCTSTWLAYNDWGGANYYDGIDGPEGKQWSPTLSFLRPWTRGLVWLPPGAPRLIDATKRAPMEPPRYPTKEWAFTNGFAQYFASSGWAQFERHFVVWAEKEGYEFDIITQNELHYQPEILNRYSAGVIVGHDEYWTREMRDAVDAYVDGGGNMARFAGNFLWQVRMEDDGQTQVCYKERAGAEDPVRDTDRKHLLTCAWEDVRLNYPGATTFGVNGSRGTYVSWGGFAPRGSRGLTVYRSNHWCFSGVDMHYGDILGEDAGIVAYEVDGLDYGFRHGLPYPTREDGAPEGIEIIAMCPALIGEEQFDGEGFRYYLGDHAIESRARSLFGTVSEQTKEQAKYGSGMMVSMKRGKGEVFTAGLSEWVMGLAKGEFYTQAVTRNVLDRFTKGSA